MIKVSIASLQTFIDTLNCVLEHRVQFSTVHIPDVFCNGHLQIFSCVGIVIVRWTENFLSHCIYTVINSYMNSEMHVSLIHNKYRYAPHNDVWVNDGPHTRRWSHMIIILYYKTIVLQLPRVFTTVTCCTGL